MNIGAIVKLMSNYMAASTIVQLGNPFIDGKTGSFGLIFTVDWFQTFKHCEDISVEVLYVFIMTLPN